MIDNKQSYDRVVEFRRALLADGWTVEATYKSEPVESASTCKKDGFVISLLSRDWLETKQHYPWYKNAQPKRRYECSINIWGPDSLAIEPPETYDFAFIRRGLRTCNNCKREDVDTYRYSFAGRCCVDCLAEMQRIHEFPGWCD